MWEGKKGGLNQGQADRDVNCAVNSAAKTRFVRHKAVTADAADFPRLVQELQKK
jgi:hypothetical protein